jgi:hypothetical protein
MNVPVPRIGSRPGAFTAGHFTRMDFLHESVALSIIFKESALLQGLQWNDKGCTRLAVALQFRALDTNFRNRMELRRVTLLRAEEIAEAPEVEPDWPTKVKRAYDQCQSSWLATMLLTAMVMDFAEFWLSGRSSTLNMNDVIIRQLCILLLLMVPLAVVLRTLPHVIPELASAVYTHYVVLFLYVSGVIPHGYILPVLRCFTAMSLLFHTALRYTYNKACEEFRTLGTTPSIAKVNEKLVWFDETARHMLLLPVLLGVGYFLFRCLYSEALLMAY